MNSVTLLTSGLVFGAALVAEEAEAIALPELPYALDALEPVISSRTLEFHHGKHHAAYVKNTLAAVEGTDLEGKPLVEVVRAAAKDDKLQGLFNNAAQVWNHTFYWNCMKPTGGGGPSGNLLTLVNSAFGGVPQCLDALAKAAGTRFGSGWAWLVHGGGKLEIYSTANADTPIVHGHFPLLCIDVWEHAYYLDYQNRRPDHVRAVLDRLLNWEFAERNLQLALG